MFLIACGNNEFFSLSEFQICSILKNNFEILNEFVSKHAEASASQISIEYNSHNVENEENPSNEVLEIHESVVAGNLPVELENSVCEAEVLIHSSTSIVVDNSDIATLNVENYFKKNGLYYLLSSSLEGLIVLGKYKKSKFPDYGRLKNIIMLNELKEDPISYK